jgi:ketosteroid isomerase-like protein
VAAEADFEVVSAAWDAFSRDDLDAVLALIADDAEVVPFGAAMEGKSYHGHEGVLDWWSNDIHANWEFFEVHPEGFQEAGDRLVVFGRWRARGRTSGVVLEMPATWVVRVRDGKITAWSTHTDRNEALRAAGLEP